MLDNAAQTVAVSCDQDTLALLQLWNDDIVPVWQCALNGQLERLKLGELLWLGSLGVTGVLVNGVIVGMTGFHWWWWGVEAAAPDLHLSLAVLGSGFGLVQTSQTTVVTLVQAPGLLDWNSLLTTSLQNAGECFLGTGQHRCVCDIEGQTSILNGFASS